MKFFGDVVAFVVVVAFLVLAVIFTPITDSGDNLFGFAFHQSFSGYAVPFSYGGVDTDLFK